MNTMKEVKIIQSKTEPNKNHLWLSDEGLKQFKGNGWEQVLSNDNEGSGGGSTDPNDENYVEYIIYPNIPTVLYYSSFVKSKLNDDISITPTGLVTANPEMANAEVIAVAILPNARIIGNGMSVTFKEVFIMMGLDYDNFTRITKEQFYNLNE